MSISNDNYAAYLPAVNLNYVQTLVSEVPDGRPFPSDFSLGDFAFWEESSNLWHYPTISYIQLVSIESAQIPRMLLLGVAQMKGFFSATVLVIRLEKAR